MAEALNYEQIEPHVDKLNTEQKLRLVRRITDQLLDDLRPPVSAYDVWTDEELDNLVSAKNESLPLSEIAARGLFGGWEHLGITDSVEWLMEQRRARQERNKW